MITYAKYFSIKVEYRSTQYVLSYFFLSSENFWILTSALSHKHNPTIIIKFDKGILEWEF